MGIFDAFIGGMINAALFDNNHKDLRQAVWKGIKHGAKQGINDNIRDSNDSNKKEHPQKTER